MIQVASTLLAVAASIGASWCIGLAEDAGPGFVMLGHTQAHLHAALQEEHVPRTCYDFAELSETALIHKLQQLTVVQRIASTP